MLKVTLQTTSKSYQPSMTLIGDAGVAAPRVRAYTLLPKVYLEFCFFMGGSMKGGYVKEMFIFRVIP